MFKETSHINLIEFMWFLLGLIGVVFSLLAFRNAFKDKIAVELTGQDTDMKIIAQANLMTEVFLVLLNSMVVAVGIIAFHYAPSPYPHADIAWVITCVLLAIPVCAVCISLIERRMRMKLMKGRK